MLPCLRFGAGLALGQQRLERGDQLRARLVRDDDVVDVAALGRRVGVGEARLVVADQLLPPLLGRRRLRDVAAVDDVDRALRAHDGDLRARPGEVEVGEHVLGGHDVVGAAVGLARDDGELRDRRLGEGVEQLRAVADDPAPLLVGAGQEAGDVDERDDRDVERVAGAHEARGLRGGVDVEHAGHRLRLVADDADAVAVEARRSRRRCSARSAPGPRRTRRRRRRSGRRRACRRACWASRGRPGRVPRPCAAGSSEGSTRGAVSRLFWGRKERR